MRDTGTIDYRKKTLIFKKDTQMKKHKLNPIRVDDKVAREYIEQDCDSTLEYLRMLDREAVVFKEKLRRERLQKVTDTLIGVGRWGIFVGLPAIFVVALAVMMPIETFLIGGGFALFAIGLTIAKD